MITNAVAPDKLGGLERYVRDLAVELVGEGARVRVVAKQTSPEQPLRQSMADGVEISRFTVPSKRNPLFVALYPLAVWLGTDRAVREHIRRSPTAIIHGHYPLPMLSLLLRRTEFVYTFHAPVYKEIVSERQGRYLLPGILERIVVMVHKKLERIVLNRASRIVVLSEFMKSEVLALDSRTASKIKVVPGGIDLERFRGNRDPSSAKPELAGAVVFVARRLVARTGVEQLVEAMPAVVSRFPDILLKIAGSGPREQSIREKVAELGLASNVVLMGRISDDDLIKEFREATICVTPTQELEGFGLATAEALACGTPALVTPVGANPEVVSMLSQALITNGRSPRELSEGILALLEDTDRLEAIRAGSAAFASRFGWPTVAQAYLSMYRGSVDDCVS